MTILNVDDFCAGMVPGVRVMGLDVGSKTIGLATVVWGTDVVMPLRTLARVKFTRDAGALSDIIKEMEIKGLVIGWPLLPDGRAGKRCQSVRDFAAELDRFLRDCHPGRSPAQAGGDPGSSAVRTDEGPGSSTLLQRGDVRDDNLSFPITFWDERFSTARGDEMVDNIGKTAGKSVRSRRDDIIDSLAAQQILADFINQNPL